MIVSTYQYGIMFQFTRPAWGATKSIDKARLCTDVSIHAPRVGRDFGGIALILQYEVSIHAPRVGRDGASGADARMSNVSIHAPRVGRDIVGRVAQHGDEFQFTRPAWGATSSPVHAGTR